jgi:hypothetical protein
MPNTTNNNWPTPADTDLVKNGADAIRDLGNAIDTTLGVYSPVTPGLVKLSTVTFSGVSSVSAPASTFTSTYSNYKYIILCTPTANSFISMRLRASGSDNTTSNYDLRDNNSTGTNYFNQNGWNSIAGTSRTAAYNNIGEILQPQEAKDTFLYCQNFTTDDAGNLYGQNSNGRFKGATQFDSVSFICNSGNISGVLYIYGMAK